MSNNLIQFIQLPTILLLTSVGSVVMMVRSGWWGSWFGKGSPNTEVRRDPRKLRQIDCLEDLAIEAKALDPGQIVSSCEVIIMATDMVRFLASASYRQSSSKLPIFGTLRSGRITLVRRTRVEEDALVPKTMATLSHRRGQCELDW